MVKVHLILKGWALCNTDRRHGGYQAVTTRAVFEAQPAEEQCLKCAAKLRKMKPPMKGQTDVALA